MRPGIYVRGCVRLLVHWSVGPLIHLTVSLSVCLSVGPLLHYSFFLSSQKREKIVKKDSSNRYNLSLSICHSQSVFKSSFRYFSFTIFLSLSFFYDLSLTLFLSQSFFYNLPFTIFLPQPFFHNISSFIILSQSLIHNLSFTISLSQSPFSTFLSCHVVRSRACYFNFLKTSANLLPEGAFWILLSCAD